MAIDLQRLRNLCERATPGPWEATRRYVGGVYSERRCVDAEIFGNIKNGGATPVCRCGFVWFEGDIDFISTSRAALPDLLARLATIEAKAGALAQFAHDRRDIDLAKKIRDLASGKGEA